MTQPPPKILQADVKKLTQCAQMRKKHNNSKSPGTNFAKNYGSEELPLFTPRADVRAPKRRRCVLAASFATPCSSQCPKGTFVSGSGLQPGKVWK